MAKPRPRHWVEAHLVALAVASLVATAVLVSPVPPLALLAWPFVFVYAATVGIGAYALAIRLRRTGWLATALAGAVVGGWFAVWELGTQDFWPIFRLLGAAGVAGALVFRAIVVATIGPAWWRSSTPGR